MKSEQLLATLQTLYILTGSLVAEEPFLTLDNGGASIGVYSHC